MSYKYPDHKMLSLVAIASIVVLTGSLVFLYKSFATAKYMAFGIAPVVSGVVILLVITIRKLNRELRDINKFLVNVNRRFLLAGDEANDSTDCITAKSNLVSSFEQISFFIKETASGNLDASLKSSDDDPGRRMGEIARNLLTMQQNIKTLKDEDRKRLWMTEGLHKFSELIQSSGGDPQRCYDRVLLALVRYVNAQVVGLFLAAKGGDEVVLKLRACYAYSRKKFLEKEFAYDQGLAGECFQSCDTVILKEVPGNYMSITSGLGETCPTSLVLVPVKGRKGCVGVLEVASLNCFSPRDIELMEHVGGILGAAIEGMESAEMTKELLAVSQSQTEAMRAQEEELRQNMEELEATQEQMSRQMNELNTLKNDLEKERYFFAALMDNLPDAIYFKDRNSKLTRVSRHMADAFEMSMGQIIGKSDFDFQDAVHAKKAFDDELKIMQTRKPLVDLIDKETRDDGTEVWVCSTKMPLLDGRGQVVGTFGISRDISNFKNLEREATDKEKNFRAEISSYKNKLKELERQLVEGGMRIHNDFLDRSGTEG